MQVATLFREAATLLGASMELQAPEGPGLKMWVAQTLTCIDYYVYSSIKVYFNLYIHSA